MNQKEFQSWVNWLYETEGEAIDCQELQAILPAYVDAEIAGQPLDPMIIQKVKTYLSQCPDCREVYDGLKYVVEQVDIEEEAVV